MGTKNNPAPWDCYSNAHPDEPMFVLLGRDAFAAELVRLWADGREAAGEDPSKVAEARACADHMEAWCRSMGKVPRTMREIDPMEQLGAAIRNRR
jgi:hypothetical protein